uniref:CWF21 domain-containing protein n=1 Tax=Calcidiscus leptoporus TaxID=127549 RepID=A0A7S0P537_9EUKA|mmetsp:Transcript_56005/g.128588  ORF Transcript_56005/g.128588 Transcript_56005/m.128588 type:complete len:215 (+) Transcript_56005:66-710(+)
MYNGIGLATVRGSGTNGYVQRNLSFVSKTREKQQKTPFRADFDSASDGPKQPNTDIIHHNRKREIELKVLQLRDALEEQGVGEEEIEVRVDETRRKLMQKLPKQADAGSADVRRTGETHTDAAAKQHENTALKDALGISSSYVGGSAFDRELQEQRRQDRQVERDAADAERAELLALLEKEKAREEKQQRKEARRAEKEARRKESDGGKKQRRE